MIWIIMKWYVSIGIISSFVCMGIMLHEDWQVYNQKKHWDSKFNCYNFQNGLAWTLASMPAIPIINLWIVYCVLVNVVSYVYNRVQKGK